MTDNPAVDAYLFGMPLVFNLEQVARYTTTGVGSMPAAPFNAFGHARSLATPADTFVTINNDTVYSMAQLDLGVGPIRLHVPDTGGRYYVLQFVDAWTDNFAYVGWRATGTAAGDYLLVPWGWEDDGSRLETDTVIRVPTRIASIVGRWAVAGDDDLPAVHALQDATTLTQVHPTLAPPAGLPEVDDGLSPALDFFEKLRVWSQAFPPPERDAELLASFAPLGITGGTPVDRLAPEVREALERGFADGHALLDAIVKEGHAPKRNGWILGFHSFDYNLDYFEVGTLDDDAWKIDPANRIVGRAAAAMAGLWGNHGYEAAYIGTYVDADEQPLTGERDYTLRLSPTPPVEAFWSLTMYDLPDYYLVDNPIDRYSIGDRTPGIVRDADGGITLTISAREPSDATSRANWLPAPAGAFRPVLRMYAPSPAVFDGGYVTPAITRLS